MQRASEFLGEALKKMKSPEAAPAWLKARWRAIVGGTMAAHIQPADCARGVLRVEADSREWQKQAEAMSEQICACVNREWGGMLVREIRMELVQQGGRLPYETDNNHLPFLRKRAKPKP